MDKREIAQNLEDRYAEFCDLIQNISTVDFNHRAEGKWSAAQQLDHLIRSVSPVVMGLSLPKFILRLTFGQAKRPSMDYDTLVKRYQDALANGGKSPRAYEPKVAGASFQATGTEKLRHLIARLNRLVESLSEADLDQLQAPHPLIGKLTLRELLYFTMYHVKHHQRSVEAGVE